jgi:hypothetical protein
MPTLPTCVVARNSPVGENAMAVAIDGRRNAEIRNPVGKSQTRNVESREADIIHVESGEKTYDEYGCGGITKSVMRFAWPQTSLTIRPPGVSQSITRILRSSHETPSNPPCNLPKVIALPMSIRPLIVAVLKSHIYVSDRVENYQNKTI